MSRSGKTGRKERRKGTPISLSFLPFFKILFIGTAVRYFLLSSNKIIAKGTDQIKKDIGFVRLKKEYFKVRKNKTSL